MQKWFLITLGALTLWGCYDAKPVLAPEVPEPPAYPKWEVPELPKARVIGSGARVYVRDDSTAWVYTDQTEFGVGTHLWEPRDLEGLRGLNARFVRHTLIQRLWHERRAEQIAWWTFANSVMFTEFDPIIVVHTEPQGYGWANRYAAYDLLAKDMEEIARMLPNVKYWEIGNEQNVGFGTTYGQHLHDWGKEIDRWVPYHERGRLYGEMLKRVYPAIKRGNPDAWVVMGGITGDLHSEGHVENAVLDFMRGMYDEGARNYFDIANIHTYGDPLLWNFRSSGIKVKALMAEYGDAEKPLLNTEFGHASANTICAWGVPADSLAGFDRVQKQQFEESYTWAYQSRVYWKVSPYQLMAEAEMHACERSLKAEKEWQGINWNDYSHGLLREDRVTRRPSYDWIANFVATRQPVEGRTVNVEVRHQDGRVEVHKDVPVGVRYPHVLRLQANVR